MTKLIRHSEESTCYYRRVGRTQPRWEPYFTLQ